MSSSESPHALLCLRTPLRNALFAPVPAVANAVATQPAQSFVEASRSPVAISEPSCKSDISNPAFEQR